MKKKLIIEALVVVLLSVGFVQAAKKASNPQARPFRGSVTSFVDEETDFTCECPEGYLPGGPWGGTGNITHMGKVSSLVIPCYKFHYLGEDSYFEVIGNCGEMLAANGDELNLDIPPYTLEYDVESGCFCATFVSPINGGTGRFEGATGEVTQTVVAYLPIFDTAIIPTTTSTFDGYIVY